MMFISKQLRWSVLVAAALGVAACADNDVDPSGSTQAVGRGDADFTKYVAVGNSLTAGFADNGLYREGQLNAYPNILAGQFRLAGGGEFVQPLFTEAQRNGTGFLRLRSLPTPATLGVPRLDTARDNLAIRGVVGGRPLLTEFTGANQNLGVPGIRMADVLRPGYGSALGNPLFERLVTDNTPLKTYFEYVSDNLANATFFSSWMGNNDALGYAISGGADTLTSTAFFTRNYTALLNRLTENNRKGVVVGVPNVTLAPFFRTVTLASINASIQQALPGAPALPALAIQASDAPGGVRASTPNDLFLLTMSAIAPRLGSTTFGTGRGRFGLDATNPIPSRFVLDAGEQAALTARTNEFNAVLRQQAEAKGLAYVDMNPVFAQLGQTGGLAQDGLTLTGAFVTGGVFSLDGIHLTPVGNALVANQIISAINAKYRATLPTVNVSRYRRVLLQ